MVTVKRFSKTNSQQWDEFIATSKNGTFLFNRDYMDYHADRFADHSLLFFNNEELQAVLPASEKDQVLNSHAGLTFGGMIMNHRASSTFILQAFDGLLTYMRSIGLSRLVYKCIPYIYHRLPAQEDLYALFRLNAVLIRRDLSSVIVLSRPLNYTKGTKSNLSKARKNSLRIEQSTDFETFMEIEKEILRSKYGTNPTHSTEEIRLLANKFPDKIKLYMIYHDQTCLGGCIIYETETVAHSQYIGINEDGKQMGALDFLIDYLLSHYSQTHKYFSFGISTVKDGVELNEGLIKNKESFGARAVVHDFYKIDLIE